MNDQLQELLTRVYDEGVAKAKAEAALILEAANTEAAAIKSKASSEAESIVSAATKKAQDIASNSSSDLKTAAAHSLSSLKTKITELILDKAFAGDIKAVSSDPEFIRKTLETVLEGWKKDHSDAAVTLSPELSAKLDENFLGRLKAIMDGKLNIDYNPVMKNGFTISPQDGAYKLSFTDEDFSNLFKSFLRPRTAALLFG